MRLSAERFAEATLELLFPHFLRETRRERADLDRDYARVAAILDEVLGPLAAATGRGADDVRDRFLERLPAVYDALRLDAAAIHDADPAAQGVDEVILAYPGFLAIAVYRLAHELHRLGVPLFPRLLTEFAHRQTGIDIHPGARIGAALSIDHGTGVVIGETAVIGDRVRIFQGVTLGALSVKKALASTKRHPTIGNDVVIYSNATILGGETVVGDGSIIAGNVWLTRSVPPRSVVTRSNTVERRMLIDEEPPEFVI